MVKFKNTEVDNFIAVADTLEIMVRDATHKIDSAWRQWEATKGT